MKLKLLMTLASLFWLVSAEAKLAVKISEPKVTGSKAVVKVEIKNGFKQRVESARAQLFLLDAEKKVVGQASQWVIKTESKVPSPKSKVGEKGLAADESATFNFVVSVDKPVATSKLVFTRIVLEGGRVADPKNFEIVK